MWWVFLQKIRETKSHPRPMRGLARASIRAALRTCMVHSVSARAETGSAPVFLAAVRWVPLQQIRETKSHPRSMRGLAAVHHF